jgi:hypothetical protein
MAYRFRRLFASTFGRPGARRLLRWCWRLLLALALMDAGYLVGIWPQWDLYASGPVQRSNFIRAYEFERGRHADWPALRWNPVAIEAIPQDMIWAVVVAEDARFFEHDGVDIEALRDAMEYNLSRKKMIYGASTISQQTVKNVFLNSSRDPLRKWHELLLTIGMERNLSKRRLRCRRRCALLLGDSGIPDQPATGDRARRHPAVAGEKQSAHRYALVSAAGKEDPAILLAEISRAGESPVTCLSRPVADIGLHSFNTANPIGDRGRSG